MPPTLQQVNDAIKLGLHHFNGMVLELYDVHASVVSAPIPTGKAVVSQQPGMALQVCQHSPQGGNSQGSWQVYGPGNVGYYPLLIKDPSPTWRHAGDPDSCRISVPLREVKDDPDNSGGKVYNHWVDYEFVRPPWEGGAHLVTWRTKYKARWGGSLFAPTVEMVVEKLAQDAAYGTIASIWSTYETLEQLVVGESKTVYYFIASQAVGGIPNFFPTTQYAVRLIRPAAFLLEEGAIQGYGWEDYLKNAHKIHAFLDWQGIKYDQIDTFWGITHGLPFGDPPVFKTGNVSAKGWHYTKEVWYDTELYGSLPRTFNAQPYRSHLAAGDLNRRLYLLWAWSAGPYHAVVKALQLLYYEHEDALGEVYRLLKDSNWNGYGTERWLGIGGLDQLGSALCAPIPGMQGLLFPGFFPFGVPHFRHPLCEGDKPSNIWPLAIPAYKSDWTAAFLLGSSLLYFYADYVAKKDSAALTVRDQAKLWADEAATMALKLQIPWDGKQKVPDYGWVYVPETAGAFMGAYGIDENGDAVSSGAAMWVQTALERAQSVASSIPGDIPLVKEWAPNQWPRQTIAGGASYENTLLFLKALLAYKHTVLGQTA